MLLVFLLVGRCGTVVGPAETILTGATMGTTYAIKISDALPDERLTPLAQSVDELLTELNRVFSTYVEDSELSRFNQSNGATPFALSNDLRRAFEIALETSRQTAGAFDVTVGPLVNAWGFGPDMPAAPPTEQELAALRERVGFEKLHLENGVLTKDRPDVYCDLSAVAKGYAVDRVADLLAKEGLRQFMVEVGGEVRTRGTRADAHAWQIAVEEPDPATRAVRRVVPLRDMAMATSGDYRNFFEKNGQRYSHTINPATGTPIRHALASVTVLHPECAWADAYATGINVLGPEDGFAFAATRHLAVLLVLHAPGGGFEERATPEFEQYCRQSGS